MLTELQPAGRVQEQLDLAPSGQPDSTPGASTAKPALMTATDALNLSLAVTRFVWPAPRHHQNGAEMPSWSTKQERRSPRYTPRWNEMLLVSVGRIAAR